MPTTTAGHALHTQCKPLLSLGSGASLKMAVALLGKLAVTGSYVILKLYATELFPTQIRCVYEIHSYVKGLCNICV